MSHTRFHPMPSVGERLPSIEFALPLYRLVMCAGANRDFNSIHHNTEYARSTGAPDSYANVLFLLGMWERLVREWAGPQARILAIRKFRMRRFNLVGTTVTVDGRVLEIGAGGLITVEVSISDADGITVGPGTIDVDLNNSLHT